GGSRRRRVGRGRGCAAGARTPCGWGGVEHIGGGGGGGGGPGGRGGGCGGVASVVVTSQDGAPVEGRKEDRAGSAPRLAHTLRRRHMAMIAIGGSVDRKSVV